MLLLSLISANSVVSRTDIAHYRKSRVPKPYCLLELTTQHPHAHTIFSWTPLSQGIVVRNLGLHLPRIILTYHYFLPRAQFSLIIVRIGRGISSEGTRPNTTNSISYSMPSKASASRSNGPIVFKTTTTTQFTDTQETETETTMKPSDATSPGMYKMEFQGDGDSTISV